MTSIFSSCSEQTKNSNFFNIPCLDSKVVPKIPDEYEQSFAMYPKKNNEFLGVMKELNPFSNLKAYGLAGNEKSFKKKLLNTGLTIHSVKENAFKFNLNGDDVLKKYLSAFRTNQPTRERLLLMKKVVERGFSEKKEDKMNEILGLFYNDFGLVKTTRKIQQRMEDDANGQLNVKAVDVDFFDFSLSAAANQEGIEEIFEQVEKLPSSIEAKTKNITVDCVSKKPVVKSARPGDYTGKNIETLSINFLEKKRKGEVVELFSSENFAPPPTVATSIVENGVLKITLPKDFAKGESFKFQLQNNNKCNLDKEVVYNFLNNKKEKIGKYQIRQFCLSGSPKNIDDRNMLALSYHPVCNEESFKVDGLSSRDLTAIKEFCWDRGEPWKTSCSYPDEFECLSDSRCVFESGKCTPSKKLNLTTAPSCLRVKRENPEVFKTWQREWLNENGDSPEARCGRGTTFAKFYASLFGENASVSKSTIEQSFCVAPLCYQLFKNDFGVFVNNQVRDLDETCKDVKQEICSIKNDVGKVSVDSSTKNSKLNVDSICLFNRIQDIYPDGCAGSPNECVAEALNEWRSNNGISKDCPLKIDPKTFNIQIDYEDPMYSKTLCKGEPAKPSKAFKSHVRDETANCVSMLFNKKFRFGKEGEASTTAAGDYCLANNNENNKRNVNLSKLWEDDNCYEIDGERFVAKACTDKNKMINKDEPVDVEKGETYIINVIAAVTSVCFASYLIFFVYRWRKQK